MRDDPDLGAIRTFVAVAQAGGFTAGARALGMTRSAAGKAVTRLEERLGTRLLHRTTRITALTVEGQAFYERCRQILADLDEAEAEVRQDRPEPRGTLRLSLPDSFGRRLVLPVLERFLLDWPTLAAEVNLTDRIVNILEDGYDLAIRCGGPLSDTRLVARVIARSHAVLCAAPRYLADRGVPLTAEDVAGHSRLTLGGHGRVRPWLLIPPDGDPLRLTQRGRVHLDSAEALRQSALGGLGIAYLPLFLVEADLASGALHRLLLDHRTEEVIARALYPTRRNLSVKVRMFVDRLAAELGGERG